MRRFARLTRTRGDPKNRQCIESASERAPACAGLRFIRAREAAAPLFFLANPVGSEARERRGATGSGRLLAAAAASQWVSDVCSLRLRVIRWQGGAERRAGFLFAQFTGGGRWPSYGVDGRSAGRSRGKLMGIGRLLAPDSEPAHWCLYPLARVAGGRRGPRWIYFCAMHRRRWPLAGPRARRRPGRSRGTLMVARALNSASERFGRPWRSENRECIEFTSGSAPRCADLLVSRAREAIRKIAGALNSHLKRRRLAQVYALSRARGGGAAVLFGESGAASGGRQANGFSDVCSLRAALGGAERRAGFLFANSRRLALAELRGRWRQLAAAAAS